MRDVKIDRDFLETLPLPLREILNKNHKIINNSEGGSKYFRVCAYCNKIYLLSIANERGKATFCAFCGESNPFDKIHISMNKARILEDLAIFCASGDENLEDIKNERTLKEQVIVVMATGLEVFFREIYSSGMNFKYVKIRKTLFRRFSNETKNDFINIAKTQKRFKSDLQIDFKKNLDKMDIKTINELFLKRNAIVHNNGYVDNIFLSQSGIDCKIGGLIPIGYDDLQNYSVVIWKVVESIGSEFESIIYPEFNNRIIDFIKSNFI